MLSAESKVKVSTIRKGDYVTGDWEKIMEAAKRLSQLPLFVDDPQNMTTHKLRADLTRLKQQHGIKVMVFDYLGKLRDLVNEYSDEWKRTEEIAYRLQPILVELDIAGLIVHQNIKSEYGKPSMKGVAGGKGIAFEAVCAVQIVEGDTDKSRKIVNVKPPRGVEGYWHQCYLYKDPLLPRFGQVVIGEGYTPSSEKRE